jgi:Zn finger protein HypA/HybF involved in hydrogenase expression
MDNLTKGDTTTMVKSFSIQVKCQECGKTFKTKTLSPACPRCGGSDIDVR